MAAPPTTAPRYGAVAPAADVPATSPSADAGSRRRLAAPGAALVLLGVGAVAAFASQSGGATSPAALTAATSSSSTPALLATNEYGGSGPLSDSARAVYGWGEDALVEPFRTTTLQLASGSDAETKWEVSELDASGQAERVVAAGSGAAFEVRFEKAGRWHAVAATTAGADQVVFKVLCKYVRRELRELSDSDQERYLSALEVVHRTPTVDGQAKYGANFRGYEHFVQKHLWRMTLDGCTPYHGGSVFLTAHAAFNLELEQSLQAVDPTVASAYWDYSLDDALYSQHWRTQSPLLTKNWFGAYAEPTADALTSGAVDSGRFAYLPVPTVDTATVSAYGSAPERNSYGVLTDALNNNPSPYLTRVESVCGLPSKSKLPGCKELKGALGVSHLSALASTVESSLHAQTHMQMGGVEDCAVSFVDKLSDKPQWADHLEALALTMNTLWRSMFLLDLVSCPASCAADTPFSECACSCPDLDGTFDDLDADAVYDLLEGKGVLSMMTGAVLLQKLMATDADGKVSFTGLSADDNTELFKFTLEALCHPGRMAQFATPLAATNDPMFWSLHNTFDRVWAFVRMDPTAAQPFNASWATDTSCSMHGQEDYLPFGKFASGAAGDADDLGSGSGAWQYTNEELVDYFAPTRTELPYVYASFDWDHC